MENDGPIRSEHGSKEIGTYGTHHCRSGSSWLPGNRPGTHGFTVHDTADVTGAAPSRYSDFGPQPVATPTVRSAETVCFGTPFHQDRFRVPNRSRRLERLRRRTRGPRDGTINRPARHLCSSTRGRIARPPIRPHHAPGPRLLGFRSQDEERENRLPGQGVNRTGYAVAASA